MKDITKRLVGADKRFVWHPFTQMAGWLGSEPVVIDSGDGFYLVDTEGRRYIDGVSSLWCNVHGHRVKEIDEAIINQLGKIGHSTLLGLGQTRSIELAERLIAKIEALKTNDNSSNSDQIPTNGKIQNEPLVYES